ncbi:hypothetical protein [Xanthobacter sediminis]
MKASVTARGVEGLAARLAARVLAPAAEQAAAAAAADLAERIAIATGAAPETAGTPARPLVRVTDPAVLDRVRGDAQREGDPVLDRVRLDFARGGRTSAPDEETAP